MAIKRLKALTIALIAFSLMHFGLKFVLRKYPLMTGEDAYILSINLITAVSWVLPTYIAAIMIGKYGFAYAVITGLLEACIVGLSIVLFGNVLIFLRHWYELLWSGFVVGVAGGLVWAIQSLIMKFTRGDSVIKPGTP